MKWAGNSASTEEVRSGAVAGAVLIGLGAVAGVAKRQSLVLDPLNHSSCSCIALT